MGFRLLRFDNHFVVPFSFGALNLVAKCKFAQQLSGTVLNLELGDLR